jgi:hypothetical protein
MLDFREKAKTRSLFQPQAPEKYSIHHLLKVLVMYEFSVMTINVTNNDELTKHAKFSTLYIGLYEIFYLKSTLNFYDLISGVSHRTQHEKTEERIKNFEKLNVNPKTHRLSE